MNQQDELEKLIRKIDETTDGLGEWHDATEYLEWVRKEVQGILKASRPRVVETVEELDALPVHAVIRDRHGRIHERWDPAVEGDHGWVRSGWAFNDVAAIPLVPATVLYLPEEKP